MPLTVAVQVGVRDARALVVGQLHRFVGHEQVEDVVGGRVTADDRPVDRHALDTSGELFQDAQGDRRLPRVTLDCRDIDAGRHVATIATRTIRREVPSHPSE